MPDLGLWHGRRMGYKEIESGNIKDCLYSDTDYVTWYVDRLGDLRCDAAHHDGTNHYLYRTYKPGVSEEQIDNLKEKLYYGTATRTDISRLTRRLGDDIAKVYGVFHSPNGAGRRPRKVGTYYGTVPLYKTDNAPVNVQSAYDRFGEKCRSRTAGA